MIGNIFGKNNILNVTPEQMQKAVSTPALQQNNLPSFKNDIFSTFNSNIKGSIPTSIFDNSFNSNKTSNISLESLPDKSRMSPTSQIIELGKKYQIPYTGDINKYQKEVIKNIIIHKAIQYDIPLNVALGICGNESSWSMWSDPKSGKLEQCKNMRDGSLNSSDWGAMQINDKAHPKAFPRAKYDLEYNIEYGLKFLANRNDKVSGNMNLGFGNWDRTVASYNLGHNPTSQRDYQIAQNYVSRVKKKSLQA